MTRETQKSLVAAVTMSTAAMFTLCSYELARSPSNTLFKSAYGAENLPVVMALVPLGVLAILYLYGWLLSLLGPQRTLLATTLLSGAGIVLCYIGIEANIRVANALIFILRDAYIVLLIEQYWSFLNSTLATPMAKKLNGPIIGVSSLGGIIGASLVSQLSQKYGTPSMLLLSAAAIIPAAIISNLGYQKCGSPKPLEKQTVHLDQLSLSLFRSSKALLFLLILVITTQVFSTVLDLNFQSILQNAIPERDQQTAYSGTYFAYINGGAAVMQFVAAPLLLRFLPLALIHTLLPLVYIAVAVGVIVQPSLAMAGAAFLIFKVFDYSVFRAAKEILYIPLTFNARYRAKEVIDVFGYRFGKGGTSVAMVVLKGVGIVLAPLYGWIALVAAGLWVVMVRLIFRQPEMRENR